MHADAKICVRGSWSSSCSYVLALRHGVGRSLFFFDSRRPWWVVERKESEAGIFTKRRRSLWLSFVALLLLSAGQGGEGEKLGEAKSASSRSWHLVPLESVAPAAAPKRRHKLAGAILGHEHGPVAPELVRSGIISLLCWRVFSDHGVALDAASPPSGFVPGGVAGGRGDLSRSGGDQGHDRISAILSRVLNVLEFGIYGSGTVEAHGVATVQ